MTTPVEGLWDELARLGQFPAHKRVSADHPLDLYAEISSDGRPGLLAISTDEPANPPKYEAVEVRIGRRSDGKWAVSAVLARDELKPLFSRLCEDIVEAGRQIRPEPHAGNFVLARLARWRRLLDIGPTGLLAEQQIRGLAGELVFLKAAIAVFGPATSIAGWNGPFDAPKDFELPSGFFEIKTIRHGAVVVRISSIDQLDATPSALTLVVYDLSRVEPGIGTAFTLPDLVDQIRAILAAATGAHQEFEARLLAAGYVDKPEYRKIGFRVENSRYYAVTPDFPKLARSELAHAFADATYDLFLAACEPYRTGTLRI